MPGGSKHEDSGLPLGLEGGPEVWQNKAPQKNESDGENSAETQETAKHIVFPLRLITTIKCRQKSTVIDFVVYNC